MQKKIVVDGDGCPVKELIITEAQKAGYSVTIVTSFDHYTVKPLPAHVSMVYVDKGIDAADYRLLKLAQPKDIIITQDYGLASLALGKNCIVLHHTGFEFTLHNIDELLQKRYLGSQMRKAGKRTKGPNPFTESNRDEFKRKLLSVIHQE